MIFCNTFHHILFILQRIPCPMDEEDRKPVFRELAVSKRAADCPYMVSYYGAFFGEVHCEKPSTLTVIYNYWAVDIENLIILEAYWHIDLISFIYVTCASVYEFCIICIIGNYCWIDLIGLILKAVH